MPLHGGGTIVGVDVSILPAAARTDGTVTGEEVNITGYERVDIVIFTGTITDGTHSFSLTECATTGGSFTAVAAADIDVNATYGGTGANGAVIVAANDNIACTFSYLGTKGFIKVIATSATCSTGGVFAAGVIGSDKRHST